MAFVRAEMHFRYRRLLPRELVASALSGCPRGLSRTAVSTSVPLDQTLLVLLMRDGGQQNKKAPTKAEAEAAEAAKQSHRQEAEAKIVTPPAAT